MSRIYKVKGEWMAEEVIVNQYGEGDIYLGANEEGSLDKVIDSFVKVREQIPLPFRNKAYCEIISSGDSYGGSSIRIEIGYRRPARIEEIESHEAKVLKEQHHVKQRELETLARLKAKYES